MKYVLTLKNEKEKTYRAIREITVVLNLLGMIYLVAVAPKDFKNLVWPVFGIFVSAVYIIIIILERISREPSDNKWGYTVFIVSSIAWSKHELYWWISFVILFLFLMDILVYRKLEVVFAGKYVKLPLLFRKKINWNQLNNVVLKDGMLTVDFKSNRLFQYPVLESGLNIDEIEFNRFCYQQIVNALR